ncbi:MAG: TonB-dependent receptor plug domain-containing protein, partial [Pseudomonadales bacterium]
MSLIAFAEQAGVTLIFPFEIAEGKTTNKLSGTYQIEEALKILLAKTGLTADLANDGRLRIVEDSKTGFSAVIASLFGSVFGEEDVGSGSTHDEVLMLEEVTVTARRKSENLQTVPDSIVAFSGDIVQRSNITEARDVSMRIPNVSVVESLSPTSTYIIVRGIASVRNSEPAVAVIVDGVQVGSATEVSQSYYDVEQIELLKGPQG